MPSWRIQGEGSKDLAEGIRQGAFREDLFYRLNVIPIVIPPLRDRKGDIVELANYFKQQFAERHHLTDKEWSAGALTAMESYNWPGNIRELENMVARAFVMAEGTVIRKRDLGFINSEDDDQDAGRAEGHGRQE